MKDNGKFWKTVNPLFSKRCYLKESISLINKDGLITKNEDLANTFYNFLVALYKTRHRARTRWWIEFTQCRWPKTIAKYENHLSTLRIKNYMKKKDLNCSLEFVDKPNILKEINHFDRKKACQEHDIPVKLIKLNKNLLFSIYIAQFQ